MNCKPGELAFVVSSQFPENIGTIVEIIDIAARATAKLGAATWKVKTAARGFKTKNIYSGKVSSDVNLAIALDSNLRPIRGFDLEKGIRDELFDPKPIFSDPEFMDLYLRGDA